jgi:hypothetical protein
LLIANYRVTYTRRCGILPEVENKDTFVTYSEADEKHKQKSDMTQDKAIVEVSNNAKDVCIGMEKKSNTVKQQSDMVKQTTVEISNDDNKDHMQAINENCSDDDDMKSNEWKKVTVKNKSKDKLTKL